MAFEELADYYAAIQEQYKMHSPRWDDDYVSEEQDRLAIFLYHVQIMHLRDDLMHCIENWKGFSPNRRSQFRQLAKEMLDFQTAELPNDKV